MTDAPVDPVEHFEGSAPDELRPRAQPWSDGHGGLPRRGALSPTALQERLSRPQCSPALPRAPDALIGHRAAREPGRRDPATVEAPSCSPSSTPSWRAASPEENVLPRARDSSDARSRCILDARFNMNGIQATMNARRPPHRHERPLPEWPRDRRARRITGCSWGRAFVHPTRPSAARSGSCYLNLGGGIPGVVDMSTFGSPSKFAYCLRENEEISPWPSLAEERGFAREENVVTACAGEGPRVALDDSSDHPDGVLTTIASTIATMGTRHAYSRVGLTVIMGPEHAQLLADHGYSREDAKAGIAERARLPVGLLKRGGRYRGNRGRKERMARVGGSRRRCVHGAHDQRA